MSEVKSINGFLITQEKDGQWWIDNFGGGEKIAGPFPTEKAAIEVASVLQLEHPTVKRRGKDKT